MNKVKVKDLMCATFALAHERSRRIEVARVGSLNLGGSLFLMPLESYLEREFY